MGVGGDRLEFRRLREIPPMLALLLFKTIRHRQGSMQSLSREWKRERTLRSEETECRCTGRGNETSAVQHGGSGLLLQLAVQPVSTKHWPS